MVPKLEAIKGGGGSIKVGTTGTISALMTRELESTKSSSPQTSSNPRDLKIRTGSVSVPCSVTGTTPRRLQPKKPMDEASTSGSRSPETLRKANQQAAKGSHRVPMLGSDNLTLERTPNREKKSSNKKVINIVEVVDIKCGSPDRAWATPLTSKLKKLGFSKLSESVV